jgi:hypothetical protein
MDNREFKFFIEKTADPIDWALNKLRGAGDWMSKNQPQNLRHSWPDPVGGAAQHAAQAAPAAGRAGMPKWLLPAAGLGALGVAAYRGMGAADEQDARTRDLISSRRESLQAPMPSMSVYASYEKRANEPHQPPSPDAKPGQPRDFMSPMLTGGTNALVGALAQQLVTRPLDATFGFLKKKLYTQPQEKKVFHQVSQDPMISEHLLSNPQQVREAHDVLKKFGPSMASNPSATRNFLRQVISSGGTPDFATIRMLAETEKMIRQGQQPGGGGH